MSHPRATIGVVGGSGLYGVSSLTDVREFEIETPYGAPSDAFRIGRIEGVPVAFLARHGRAHHLLPGEVPYRANVWAFKKLGVERLLSASAVGSLKESIEPRHAVTVDQFIDRSRARPHTFFGEGIVAHVGMADPVCAELRDVTTRAIGAAGGHVHDGGTYVGIEGPAFSTRAESMLYRSWGGDVIGMTNHTEARLAREAELCYASIALVTDFDCWHEDEADVTVAALLANLRANGELAADVVVRVVAGIGGKPRACACATALDDAVLNSLAAVPEPTLERLEPILARFRRARESGSAC
jgi:5'-methylthioadenosine phosphorylase